MSIIAVYGSNKYEMKFDIMLIAGKTLININNNILNFMISISYKTTTSIKKVPIYY